MKHTRKRKKDLPWTGILLAVVLILGIIVAAIGWRVFQKEKSDSSGTNGDGAAVQTKQEGKLEKETGAAAVIESELSSGADALQKPGNTDEEESTQQEIETSDGSGIADEEESADQEMEVLTGKEETEDERSEESELLVEVESETEPETEAEKLVVAVDPGHQGNWVDMSEKEPSAPGSTEMKAKSTTGTQGRFSGKMEFELNMEVSLLLKEELEERGYEVVLTREDNDTAISNSERALKAYNEGGDIYVRIHANGSDDAGIDGALGMVPSPDNPYVGHLAEDSYLLADCIVNAYCEKASFDSLGIQYYDNMTGINWSRLPVMILEMGFMTNESDDMRMADPQVQVLMAEGIADGIDDYFTQKGMKEKEVSPEAQTRVDTIMEILGEEYIYPARDKGEEWAVSLVDVTTGAEGDFNGEVSMKSASVIKAFILAAVYDRVCYPASSERQLYIEESYDGELKQLLTDMITVSSNEAANTLIERLGGGDPAAGMEVVNQFCQENGYTGTSLGRRFLESSPVGDNYVSAKDCSRLLASIYNGTCVNQEASAKMYEYFKNQTRINKIPAGLTGTEAAVANKTGELAGDYGDYVENDIAVIEDGDCTYVLSILSGNLQDNGAAIEQIAGMARCVYEQMHNEITAVE